MAMHRFIAAHSIFNLSRLTCRFLNASDQPVTPRYKHALALAIGGVLSQPTIYQSVAHEKCLKRISLCSRNLSAVLAGALLWLSCTNGYAQGQPRTIAWLPLLPSAVRLQDYTLHHQEYLMSCEAAALSMATHGRLTEDQILAVMPYNPNPYLGFRGSLDRPADVAAGLPDYGIYAPALATAAQRLGYETRVIDGPHARALVEYAISELHLAPVVWTTWQTRTDWPRLVGHANGQSFLLIEHEHANALIGYDAQGVYVLDPWDGALYHPWSPFLAVWQGVFGGMSLLAAPRIAAPALQHGAARLVGRSAVWSWAGALPGSVAHVTVYRGQRAIAHLRLPMYIGGSAQRVRLPVTPGAPYRIVVHDVAPLDAIAPLYVSGLVTLAELPRTDNDTATRDNTSPRGTAMPRVKETSTGLQ